MKTVEVDEAGPHLEDLIEAAQRGEYVVLTRNGKPVVWVEPIEKLESGEIATLIILAAAEWNTTDEFYTAFFDAVGAPPWHGRNLDALWDSITRGGINRVNPPFRIRMSGLRQTSADCRQLIDRFAQLIEEAKAEGINVDLTREE
jgi:prevent-host-death family protein